MSNVTHKIFVDKMGGHAASDYIGVEGDLFFDAAVGQLRISDGETPGGRLVELAEASGVQVTKTLWVDGNRTDAYEENGTIITPFKTIQSALNAAVAGTTIFVGAGTYTENLFIPNLDGLALIGASEMNTIIQNDGDSNTITWIPTGSAGAAVQKFALKYFTVICTADAYAIEVDASAILYPNVFCGEEFDITEVDFDGYMNFVNTGVVYWNHGDCEGDLNINNCATFRTRNVEVGSLAVPRNVNAYYEGADDIHNGLGRTDYSFATGTVIFGNLNIQGHPIVQLDKTSLVVGNIVGTSMTSFYASGRDYCPLLSLYGQVGLAGGGQGNITLTFPNPQTSGNAYNAVDFSGAMIAGTVTLTKADYLPATARGLALIAGDANYDKTTSAIVANGYVVLDLKKANFQQSALSGTGFVDRGTVTFIGATSSTGGTTLTISPPLPTGATYAVSIGASSAVAVWAGNKSASSLKLYSASGTPAADVTLHRI